MRALTGLGFKKGDTVRALGVVAQEMKGTSASMEAAIRQALRALT